MKGYNGMDEEKRIVIFGASGGAIKVAKTFENLGIDFEIYVDNDEKKWGTVIKGKEVKNPLVLKDNIYEIVIASIYQEEIEQQLREMGINLDMVVPKEKYIMEKINYKLDSFRDYIQEKEIKFKEDVTYIIDLAEGLSIGGIETWSFNLAKILKRRDKQCFVYSKQTHILPPDELKDNIVMVDMKFEDYMQDVRKIIDETVNKLPCVFVINWVTHVFWAAYILKKIFDDKIKIVVGVHHDMQGLYKRNKYIEDNVDRFLCVSSGNKSRMVDIFKVSEGKVFYLPVPIQVIDVVNDMAKDRKEAIQINFGSRLVKAQKRADKVIPLIGELEKQDVNYNLNIAGGGKYFGLIAAYVEEYGLQDKVNLYGEVEYSKMQYFWKNADIVVSLSETEGLGLSILEGMSCGAVPIVTDTAGIREFVVDNENGYVVGIGDVETMAKWIKSLDENRERLIRFKIRSRDLIQNKCSEEGYYRFFEVMN